MEDYKLEVYLVLADLKTKLNITNDVSGLSNNFADWTGIEFRRACIMIISLLMTDRIIAKLSKRGIAVEISKIAAYYSDDCIGWVSLLDPKSNKVAGLNFKFIDDTKCQDVLNKDFLAYLTRTTIKNNLRMIDGNNLDTLEILGTPKEAVTKTTDALALFF